MGAPKEAADPPSSPPDATRSRISMLLSVMKLNWPWAARSTHATCSQRFNNVQGQATSQHRHPVIMSAAATVLEHERRVLHKSSVSI